MPNLNKLYEEETFSDTFGVRETEEREEGGGVRTVQLRKRVRYIRGEILLPFLGVSYW